MFQHQLLQEYFAARELARVPKPERVAAPWRVADIRPGLREILDDAAARRDAAGAAATGWEETTILAAAMVGEPEPFLRALMAHNLVVAGRAARLPTVRAKLSAAFLDELRWALVGRSRDPEADLRARIDAGLALGWLGDPRFERRVGPHGEYLVPPLVAIPGGEYPIGDDEPIEYIGGDDHRAHAAPRGGDRPLPDRAVPGDERGVRVLPGGGRLRGRAVVGHGGRAGLAAGDSGRRLASTAACAMGGEVPGPSRS